jgi:hypothetical protein
MRARAIAAGLVGVGAHVLLAPVHAFSVPWLSSSSAAKPSSSIALSPASAPSAAAETPVAQPGSLYERAQSFYNAWNDRDVEHAISHFADDVYFTGEREKKKKRESKSKEGDHLDARMAFAWPALQAFATRAFEYQGHP